jgi:hypothetical protein
VDVGGRRHGRREGQRVDEQECHGAAHVDQSTRTPGRARVPTVAGSRVRGSRVRPGVRLVMLTAGIVTA